MDESIPSQSPVIPDAQPVSQPPPQRRKLFVIGAIIAVILVLVVGVILLSLSTNREVVSVEDPKTWQLIVTYTASSDQFKLKELQLLDKEINPDRRSAKFSEFELKILDGKGSVLSSEKVTLMTKLLDGNMLVEPYSSGSGSTLEETENILYAPFFSDGKKIILTRSGKTVLELEVPSKKKALINIPKISKAYAQSCSPLKVAIISDGYTDFNKFHENAQTFADAFINTAPYNSKNPSIFDFKIIDNSQSLGCVTNGILYCIENQTAKADQIVRAQYPDVSKIVILANGPEQNPKDGGVLGVASGIGGDYTVFPTNRGNITSRTLVVARHELLGHSVGLLYDRYVAADPNYGFFGTGIRSNCTDKSGGEPFWASAGVTGATLGCTNNTHYGPPATMCPKPQNPQLLSGGTPTSLMSAVGCGGPNFDAVEQYWITNNILPDYIGCEGGTTPIPPVAGATKTPTPTTKSGSTVTVDSILGTVFNDTNSNGIKDTGEAGVVDAVMTLAGVASKTTTTGTDGRYSFTGLANGNYTVKLTYLGQSVTSSNIELSSLLSGPPIVNFAVRIDQNNPPVIVPVTPTPTIKSTVPTPTPVGSSGGSGGFQINGTPTPTPDQYYTCNPDPSCVKNGKSIQLCPLICTPQG